MTMGMMPGPGIGTFVSGGDPYWASVFSLMYASGANGSTSFPDQISGRVWTPTSASISTADSPFTGGSCGNLGASGYLTTGTLSDWTFLHNGSVWTIDIWVKFNSVSSTQMIFATNSGSSANIGIGVWNAATGVPRVLITNGGSAVINWSGPANTFAANTWYLFSIQMAVSGSMRFFVNGAFVGTMSGGSFSTSAPTYALQIGASGNSTLPLNGKISNWRVTKGVVRYPTNGTGFTVPTAPFPNHA